MTAILDPTRKKSLQRCLQTIGAPVQAGFDWALLDRALTHASFSSAENYEHLEFLGDSVLRLAAAEFLLEGYAEASVGELAAIRSRLVSDQTLADLSEMLGLEPYLQVSAAARRDLAGRRSRLADALEAILGVLYLQHHDLRLIRSWLDPLLQRLVDEVRQDPTLKNYKAALQELTQAHGGHLPEYRNREISQAHGDPERFAATVWFHDRAWGHGRGHSIKAAEQAAAAMAYPPLKQFLEST